MEKVVNRKGSNRRPLSHLKQRAGPAELRSLLSLVPLDLIVLIDPPPRSPPVVLVGYSLDSLGTVPSISGNNGSKLPTAVVRQGFVSMPWSCGSLVERFV